MRFFRRILILLGSATACASAQAPLPTVRMTPDLFRAICSQQPGPACMVPISGSTTLALQGDWHLPHGMHLRFAPGSTLSVSGGVLHFDSATIDASPNAAVFPDADRIRDLADARPEWFAPADLSSGPIPATALAEAYEATVPWGTIYLQDRQYISPFHACPGSALRFDSPRTLVGAGRPVPDDLSSPTHLQNGTTLLGGITGTAPLRMAHLGIDAGPQVAARVLHGCEPPAVFIEQPDRTFVSGDRVEDVSILTTGQPNMHSVMFAGHRDTQIKDLWIWTLGGTHGLVMKSEDSVVDGLHCWGAANDCLIVKSDYATSFLGRAVHDRVSNVEIHPLRPGTEVGGIMVESRWDTVRDLQMDHIQESGTRFGIVLLGSTFYHPRDIRIRDWNARDVTGLCLFADKADGATISGFGCGLMPGAQAGALLIQSQNIIFNGGHVRCLSPVAQCDAAVTDGFLNDAAGTSIATVVVQGLRGYAVRNSGNPARLTAVEAVDMGGRLTAGFPISRSSRFRDVLLQTKPNLRILYTAVTFRVRHQPLFYCFWILAGTLILLILLRLRRKVSDTARLRRA